MTSSTDVILILGRAKIRLRQGKLPKRSPKCEKLMRVTFRKLGASWTGESFINVDRVVIPQKSCFWMHGMDKGKPDKAKKKKLKETEELGGKIKRAEEVNEEVQEHTETATRDSKTIALCGGKTVPESISSDSGKMFINAEDCGRNIPEGFYIAHPRNIKRTAHFKDVHSRKLSELLEAFHMFDFDRDGIINHNDLRKTFASLCIDVDDEEINQMLQEGLNPLNFDSFVILLGYKTLDLDPEEVLLDAFSNWDDHQEGLISYERLKQHLMAWGEKFAEDEAIAALADAPIVLHKTKEKMIDYIQFSEDLCGLRKMMQRKTGEGN